MCHGPRGPLPPRCARCFSGLVFSRFFSDAGRAGARSTNRNTPSDQHRVLQAPRPPALLTEDVLHGTATQQRMRAQHSFIFVMYPPPSLVVVPCTCTPVEVSSARESPPWQCGRGMSQQQ